MSMKVVLLSDASLCINAGGIHQTLYNVLSFIKKEDILCIAPDTIVQDYPPSEPYTSRYITYSFEAIPLTKNRFSKYINPYIDWFNYSFSYKIRKFRRVVRAINEFEPELIIACYNGPVGVVVHNKLSPFIRCKNVIPYFMDDWMGHEKRRWWGGEIHRFVRNVLGSSKKWMMISQELSDILAERYGVGPAKLFVVHNPVEISDAPPYYPLETRDVYRFVYAGSLWPMHYDSFLLLAKALQKATHKNTLTIYAPESFWDWRKGELELQNVNYGGSIPYSKIHKTLAENADFAILVSSFKKEWETHSRGSVQTKITDYLKSRKLIVSCGPAYSANHNFLKINHCGICVETTDIDDIVKCLDNIMDNVISNKKYVDQGWDILQEKFSKGKIHEELQQFFADSSVRN